MTTPLVPLQPGLLAALLLSSCVGGGAGDGAIFFRFESTGIPYAPGGAARSIIFKDRYFLRSATGLSEFTTAGPVERPGLFAACANATAMYALKNAGVWKSTDGETFTQLSTESFTELGLVNGKLVALRPKSFGIAEVFLSYDEGVTWKQLEDITAGTAFGNSWSRFIGVEMNGRIRLGVSVMDDSLGNANYAGQGYELLGEALELISGANTPPAPAFPDAVTAEGLAFFHNSDTLPAQQGDAVSILALEDTSRAPDLTKARRVRWARTVLPYDVAATVDIIGLDSAGHLIVGAEAIYRSARPVREGDQSAEILRGPGCSERATFEPNLRDDNLVSVTMKNATGQKVLVRQVDNQHRWQRLGELEDGASQKLSEWRSGASRENARIMVSDPVDDTCLGLYVVREGVEEIVASP